ncbi:hypothetical protein DOY81_006357, partial [Sarcophaga bullata]
EQPIFTCQAHVFHIDPKTKRTWITASMKAVNVSFFYDSSRNLYRIISVEGTKAVINSTITPNMTFTQTSQKFGQWSDVRANTVYGLGFSSEAELTKFVEKFQEVKEATKNALKSANGSAAVTPTTSANTSPISSRTAAMQQNDNATMVDPHTVEPPNMSNTNTQNANPDSPSHKLLTTAAESKSEHVTAPSPAPMVNVSSGGGSSGSVVGMHTGSGPPTSEQQLKYENERLKMALAQSCANAKKWEIELATLKNNNLRLTSALQESTANVDEWKRQLHTYKEENIRLKREIELIRAGAPVPASVGGAVSSELVEELRRELAVLKARNESLQNELMNQELELKAANMNLREKCNDQAMAKMSELNVLFAKHLSELFAVQKDMENISEENAASLRNYLQPSLGLPCAMDTESTLSNVTSIQSQLQSLYETCHDPLKIYQSLQPTTINSSDKTSNLQKALDKHTHLLQELKLQQQRQFKPNTTSQTNNPATFVVSPAKSAPGGIGGGVTAGAAGVTVAGGVTGKTATILVSKSKTKTGLPLLLKNSINN